MGSLTMSQEAFDLFDRALSEQHARNEARRIRIRVHEARGNPLHGETVKAPGDSAPPVCLPAKPEKR